MKHKPQTLTSRLLSAPLALSATVFAVLTIAPIYLVADEDGKPSAAPLTESAATAGEVFQGVSDKLDGLNGFSCEIRQTLLLGGHRLHARGRYFHASGNRLRLEYRLFPIRATKADDRRYLGIDSEPEDISSLKPSGSLTQVSDGSVLWTYWVNAGQKQLTRRNIREIVEAADAEVGFSSAASLRDLGVGGMQSLIAQLQVGMDFGAVREQETARGKMLILSGRWNARTRKDVFRLPDDPDALLPEYVPDYIRVYVSSKSMMPTRIQYLKKHPNPEVKRIQPLTTLDFVNFKSNSTFPAKIFEFERPDDEEINEVDLTGQVIDDIRKAAEPKDEAR